MALFNTFSFRFGLIGIIVVTDILFVRKVIRTHFSSDANTMIVEDYDFLDLGVESASFGKDQSTTKQNFSNHNTKKNNNNKIKKNHSVEEINRPSLPDMSNGGIVLFFHIPKTGGSTFRNLAKINDKFDIYSNGGKTPLKEVKDRVTKWSLDPNIVNQERKVKFEEFHWNYDPLYELIDDIRTWRSNAEKNNVPFFVFTMVRDPLDTYISIYNYFCKILGQQNYTNCPPPYTIDNMIEISRDNPQSRYLCYATVLNVIGSRRDATDSISMKQGCGDIIQLVEENMDWVGTLENIKVTLGLFASMGINLGIKHLNKVRMNFSANQMSQTTLDTTVAALSEDRRLFEWVSKTYTLSNYGVNDSFVENLKKA